MCACSSNGSAGKRASARASYSATARRARSAGVGELALELAEPGRPRCSLGERLPLARSSSWRGECVPEVPGRRKVPLPLGPLVERSKGGLDSDVALLRLLGRAERRSELKLDLRDLLGVGVVLMFGGLIGMEKQSQVCERRRGGASE